MTGLEKIDIAESNVTGYHFLFTFSAAVLSQIDRSSEYLVSFKNIDYWSSLPDNLLY